MRAWHGFDATAAARRGHPPGRGTLLLLALLAAHGCGDPVGDPSDRFEVDPAPVVGVWVEREPTDDPPRRAIVEAGEGILAGRFAFERTGLTFRVTFSDATWDGTDIRFLTGDIFGTGAGNIPWTARFVPAEGSDPALLRFFPRIGNSVPFSVEYVRP